MRGSRALFVATLFVVLAACAAQGPAPPMPEPTIPEPPGIPEGWQVVTSEAGDVQIAVPPDLAVLDLSSGILLQGEMVAGSTPIQVFAIGPGDAQVQPAGGESLRAWLRASSWAPTEGSGGITGLADETEREVWLPAGRALEVAMTAQPGTPDASRVVVYAIETPEGFGVLQILGHPDFMEQRRRELSLLPLLISFGDGS